MNLTKRLGPILKYFSRSFVKCNYGPSDFGFFVYLVVKDRCKSLRSNSLLFSAMGLSLSVGLKMC